MLKLNVGLSKKVGMPNYGSKGATVNLEAEVDSHLMGDPQRLREHLRKLFGMARVSLEEELQSEDLPTTSVRNELPSPGEPYRPATPAQCRMILSFIRRLRMNLLPLLREQTGKLDLAELSLGEASKVIHFLKSRESHPVIQEV